MTHQLDLTGNVAQYDPDATEQATLDQFDPQAELDEWE